MLARVLYSVHFKVPLNKEREWNRWHDQEHIPEVLALPGFVSARKFRCVSNDNKFAQYLVLYELRNMAAYEQYVKSEDGVLLRQKYLDVYGTATHINRRVWKETLNLVK